MLLLSQGGYEDLLEGELKSQGVAVREKGRGWVAAEGRQPPESAFAHLGLADPLEIRAASVNALAGAILDFFLGRVAGERIDSAWTCLFIATDDAAGLGRRAGAVEADFHARLKKRLSRVSRLARPSRAVVLGPDRGLFAVFTGFDRAFVSREAYFNGQRRMADDPDAPSRSYLKVEEAYGLIGEEPAAGETVVDLGAAPGGWSYSAAKRGARVIAVDRGPLRGGALGHPLIAHLKEDAFGYRPPGRVEWLFCDLVEEPHHVLENIVRPWLVDARCLRFIVNLKFGRVRPLALLSELGGPPSPFRRANPVRIRHLFHDREEFTIAGLTLPPQAAP